MIRINQQLVLSPSPMYCVSPGGYNMQTLEDWANEAQSLGVNAIICLLSQDQLEGHRLHARSLIDLYHDFGFDVVWISVEDMKSPPLSQDEIEQVWSAYESLVGPVLVHCQAAMQRSPYAMNAILEKHFPGEALCCVSGFAKAMWSPSFVASWQDGDISEKELLTIMQMEDSSCDYDDLEPFDDQYPDDPGHWDFDFIEWFQEEVSLDAQPEKVIEVVADEPSTRWDRFKNCLMSLLKRGKIYD